MASICSWLGGRSATGSVWMNSSHVVIPGLGWNKKMFVKSPFGMSFAPEFGAPT